MSRVPLRSDDPTMGGSSAVVQPIRPYQPGDLSLLVKAVTQSEPVPFQMYQQLSPLQGLVLYSRTPEGQASIQQQQQQARVVSQSPSFNVQESEVFWREQGYPQYAGKVPAAKIPEGYKLGSVVEQADISSPLGSNTRYLNITWLPVTQEAVAKPAPSPTILDFLGSAWDRSISALTQHAYKGPFYETQPKAVQEALVEHGKPIVETFVEASIIGGGAIIAPIPVIASIGIGEAFNVGAGSVMQGKLVLPSAKQALDVAAISTGFAVIGGGVFKGVGELGSIGAGVVGSPLGRAGVGAGLGAAGGYVLSGGDIGWTLAGAGLGASMSLGGEVLSRIVPKSLSGPVNEAVQRYYSPKVTSEPALDIIELPTVSTAPEGSMEEVTRLGMEKGELVSKTLIEEKVTPESVRAIPKMVSSMEASDLLSTSSILYGRSVEPSEFYGYGKEAAEPTLPTLDIDTEKLVPWAGDPFGGAAPANAPLPIETSQYIPSVGGFEKAPYSLGEKGSYGFAKQTLPNIEVGGAPATSKVAPIASQGEYWPAQEAWTVRAEAKPAVATGIEKVLGDLQAGRTVETGRMVSSFQTPATQTAMPSLFGKVAYPGTREASVEETVFEQIVYPSGRTTPQAPIVPTFKSIMPTSQLISVPREDRAFAAGSPLMDVPSQTFQPVKLPTLQGVSSFTFQTPTDVLDTKQTPTVILSPATIPALSQSPVPIESTMQISKMALPTIPQLAASSKLGFPFPSFGGDARQFVPGVGSGRKQYARKYVWEFPILEPKKARKLLFG